MKVQNFIFEVKRRGVLYHGWVAGAQNYLLDEHERERRPKIAQKLKIRDNGRIKVQ